MTTAALIDLDALARIGEALADENRRRIIVHLLTGPSYPADIAEQLRLGRTNVSNHLACLRGCGLVAAAPEGRRIRYQLADERLADALVTLSTLDLGAPHGCRHQP